jgi:hypothetical protein
MSTLVSMTTDLDDLLHPSPHRSSSSPLPIGVESQIFSPTPLSDTGLVPVSNDGKRPDGTLSGPKQAGVAAITLHSAPAHYTSHPLMPQDSPRVSSFFGGEVPSMGEAPLIASVGATSYVQWEMLVEADL